MLATFNPPQQPTVSMLFQMQELDLLLASIWSHYRDLEFCFPLKIGFNQSPGISYVSSLFKGFLFCDIAVVLYPSSRARRCYWQGYIAIDELRGDLNNNLSLSIVLNMPDLGYLSPYTGQGFLNNHKRVKHTSLERPSSVRQRRFSPTEQH